LILKGGDGVTIAVCGSHVAKKFIQLSIFTHYAQGKFLNKTRKIQGKYREYFIFEILWVL
jgi:hypothetical protein